MSLRELFTNVSKNLKTQFEEGARLLEQPGEIGTGRENVLRGILAKYIPQRYGVDTGFVIDAIGNRSLQTDIIIYERDYTPIFEVVEGKSFFPCETVVAVGEVRTNLNSKKAVRECLEKVKSVKLLDRSNKGRNLLITGPGIHFTAIGPFNPNTNYRDQIFGFIFTSASINQELVIEELKEFNKENECKLWTNLIVNYNGFIISYESKEGLTPNPMEAENLYCTTSVEKQNLFVLFFSILSNFLTQAHIARPNLFDYCEIEKTDHRDYAL